MKVLKAETLLKPIPDDNWELRDSGTRYVVTPITGNEGRPNGTKFRFRQRSYVFGVFAGADSWFSVKFDVAGMPLAFDLPGELILKPRPYRVFAGYSDGFLGGTFTPGYYSLKEKVEYWYCIAQTSSKYALSEYFLVGNPEDNSPLILDLSTALASPVSGVWKYYKIGDPIKIGQPGIRIGDKYDN